MLTPQLLRTWLPCTLLALAGLMPGVASAMSFDIDNLARAAAMNGWATSRAADGSLLLFPEQSRVRDVQTAQLPRPATPITPRMAALEQRLTQTGWNVQRDVDGGLLLFPRPAAAPSVAYSAPAMPAPSAGPQPGRESYHPDALDRVASALRERGWSRVERDAQGNLLLFPRTSGSFGQTAATMPQTHPAQAYQAIANARPDPLDRLARVLSDRGWRTARDLDGSLLVFFR